jgi:hypothetical protein
MALLVRLGIALGVWIVVDVVFVLVMELAARARERCASTLPTNAVPHTTHRAMPHASLMPRERAAAFRRKAV